MIVLEVTDNSTFFLHLSASIQGEAGSTSRGSDNASRRFVFVFRAKLLLQMTIVNIVAQRGLLPNGRRGSGRSLEVSHGFHYSWGFLRLLVVTTTQIDTSLATWGCMQSRTAAFCARRRSAPGKLDRGESENCQHTRSQ